MRGVLSLHHLLSFSHVLLTKNITKHMSNPAHFHTAKTWASIKNPQKQGRFQTTRTWAAEELAWDAEAAMRMLSQCDNRPHKTPLHTQFTQCVLTPQNHFFRSLHELPSLQIKWPGKTSVIKNLSQSALLHSLHSKLSVLQGVFLKVSSWQILRPVRSWCQGDC